MEKYNGWTNYETWLCKLWLDEQGVTNWYYDYIRESEEDVTAERLAAMIENEHWSAYEEQIKTGFFSDLISQSLRVVNFHEIAESIKESV